MTRQRPQPEHAVFVRRCEKHGGIARPGALYCKRVGRLQCGCCPMAAAHHLAQAALHLLRAQNIARHTALVTGAHTPDAEAIGEVTEALRVVMGGEG